MFLTLEPELWRLRGRPSVNDRILWVNLVGVVDHELAERARRLLPISEQGVVLINADYMALTNHIEVGDAFHLCFVYLLF